jgi:predicted CXXCH cytochrome family protein
MCKACHSNTINEMFAKKRVHWALLDQVGCLNCHSPHASDQEGLLSKPMMTVCGQCHSDTVERVKTAESKHPPVQEGKCTICHSPHASGQLSLIEEASVVDACSTCHEWGKHSTHPIGAKYIDKRNKNLSVTCLSCHRPHGTPYKKMMIFPTSTETCTDCHEKLKR